MRSYSKEIAEAVKQFLTEDDWQFDFDEEDGIFDFTLKLKSKIQRIQYVIVIRENAMVVYAISPISADHEDPQMMSDMSEFVCRSNHGLVHGNFEICHEDGEIRYKTYVDCDDSVPTIQLVKNSIYYPGAMFKRYAPGITGIIFGGMTAKEAVEMCESRSRQFSQILDALSDNPEDLEKLLQLADQVGISSADSAEDDE